MISAILSYEHCNESRLYVGEGIIRFWNMNELNNRKYFNIVGYSHNQDISFCEQNLLISFYKCSFSLIRFSSLIHP